jgi:uncharacterized protein (TIGR03437 family)
MRYAVVLPLLFAAGGAAQNPPAVNPRGVLNAYSLAPALSTVGRGGLISISGINLGPETELVAPGLPWPTALGDPPVEVQIGSRLAPLYSVSATKIVAQVPFEIAPGTVEVTVRRGGVAGRATRLAIVPADPAVRSAAGDGLGATAATLSGSSFSFVASGLGLTAPRVNTGEAANPDTPAAPMAPVAAFIGGVKVTPVVSHSTKRAGEYDIQVEVPAGAKPGDVLTLMSGNRAASRTTFQRLAAPEMQLLKLPDGAPDLRAIASPDLNGGYWMGSAARGADGCYPSWVFDAVKQTVAPVEGCITSGNANAITPAFTPNEGTALAAFAGPAQAAAPNGVSARIQIFSPARTAPLSVELPGAASQIGASPGGNFSALIPGAPNRVVLIDAQTGEMQDGPAAGGPNAAGGAAGPVGLLLNQQVNVEGLTSLLALPVPLPQGRFGVIVGDNAGAPSRPGSRSSPRPARLPPPRNFRTAGCR